MYILEVKYTKIKQKRKVSREKAKFPICLPSTVQFSLELFNVIRLFV